MAKKKKSRAKVGALGPAAHWLNLSVETRRRTKQYIKEGFQGWIRPDGITVPGARKIYSGLSASDGFDLTHIERWSAAKLKLARDRLQSLNTLTSRPFAVLTPRTKKQRKQAQKFTGQDLPHQKEFIVQVQNPKLDKVKFIANKPTVVRNVKGDAGIKTYKQRYLFADYLNRGERQPMQFREMREITKRMLEDMPKEIRHGWVYFTILTVQYGPVGQSVPHHRLLDELSSYYTKYDTMSGHAKFAEDVIGYQMVGTEFQAASYQIMRDNVRAQRKQMKKLRFSKKR